MAIQSIFIPLTTGLSIDEMKKLVHKHGFTGNNYKKLDNGYRFIQHAKKKDGCYLNKRIGKLVFTMNKPLSQSTHRGTGVGKWVPKRMVAKMAREDKDEMTGGWKAFQGQSRVGLKKANASRAPAKPNSKPDSKPSKVQPKQTDTESVIGSDAVSSQSKATNISSLTKPKSSMKQSLSEIGLRVKGLF